MIKKLQFYINSLAESSFFFAFIFSFILIIFSYKNYLLRKRINYPTLNIKVDKLIKNGFQKDEVEDKDFIRRLISYADKNYLKFENEFVGKSYIKRLPLNPREDIIYQFIKSQKILGTANKYFGFIPILNQCAIWLTDENFSSDLHSSQLFHFDHEPNQLKFFINLVDIDDDSGPLYFFNKPTSLKIYRKLKKLDFFDLLRSGNFTKFFKFSYKITEPGFFKSRNMKIEDQIIYKYTDKTNLNNNIGKKGTMTLIDTTRCYHYGGRTTNKKRMMFHLQFVSPFTYLSDKKMLKLVKRSSTESNKTMLDNLLFTNY